MDKLRSREKVSKWLMRVNQSSRQLRLVFFGVTAVSTTITATRGTFLEPYTGHIIGAFGIGTAAFTYLYDRLGVLNVQNRWSNDRTDNFVGPNTAINHLVQARALEALVEEIQKEFRDPGNGDASRITEATENAIREYRDGVAMGRFDRGA